MQRFLSSIIMYFTNLSRILEDIHFNKTLADAPRSTTTSQKVKYVRIDTVHYLTVWKNSFYLTKKDFDIKKFFESKENL